jgi:CelD/BcsL family acetyltransferase involved in cellulose biosynthesis
MKITLIPATQLTPDLVQAWSRFQEQDPALESAFFRPEFTQVVASCRDDVEVAIFEQDGEVAGFFPFQRGALNIGTPVGGRLSDFHGVIARRDLQYDAMELIRACRLSTWDFHNLIASQEAFSRHHCHVMPSPYMDLSEGFDAFYAKQRKTGSALIPEKRRRERKMIREVGPVTFEARTIEPAAFQALLNWKSQQYRETNVTNIFTFPWTVEVLKKILDHHGKEFSGMLSTLHAGEHLVSVHYAMRSGPALHSWFPAYDRAFSAYSPGTILMLKIAEVAPSLGVQRIDMCSGPGRYKDSLMSDSRKVARGSVACSLPTRLFKMGWHRTKTWVRRSSLATPARVAGRLARPLRGWLAFR